MDPTRRTAALVGAVVVATALVTTAASYGLAAADTPVSTGTAEQVTPFDGGPAPAVVPFAVPVGACPGSYLTTQDAGAAAPRAR